MKSNQPLYAEYLRNDNQIEVDPWHFGKLINRMAKQTGQQILVRTDLRNGIDWFVLVKFGHNRKVLSDKVIGYKHPQRFYATLFGCRVILI